LSTTTTTIGEPWQSMLDEAKKRRIAATNTKEANKATGDIRKIRLQAARVKGVHSELEWANLVAACDCRCVMCGLKLLKQQIQKDHIVPIYQGGSDGIENLQPLCAACNARKGPDSFNWVAYRLEHGYEQEGGN
jgi:5-methylcytosine-specific restriction endonuclease McrA